MGIDKRGYVFTTLSFFIIALFVISVLISTDTSNSVVHKRIQTMESFLFSLNTDMGRQIYISSYRALLAIETNIAAEGVYIPNASEAFTELLINGTLDNQTIALMEGYRIVDWNTAVAAMAQKLNLYINYTLVSIQITQEDPWLITIRTYINLTLEDLEGTAQWNRIELVTTHLPVNGFEDPFYLLGTNGLIAQKIVPTPYGVFSNGSDVSALRDHVNRSLYRASVTAPSFLDRLEGRFSANPQGIESFVHLLKLSSQGIQTYDTSVVDYLYFGNQNVSSYSIQGMPSWFKLDLDHVASYNVTHLIT